MIYFLQLIKTWSGHDTDDTYMIVTTSSGAYETKERIQSQATRVS